MGCAASTLGSTRAPALMRYFTAARVALGGLHQRGPLVLGAVSVLAPAWWEEGQTLSLQPHPGGNAPRCTGADSGPSAV